MIAIPRPNYLPRSLTSITSLSMLHNAFGSSR